MKFRLNAGLSVAVCVATVLFAGCGGSAGAGKGTHYAALPSASPLKLTHDMLGVQVRHGEAINLAHFSATGYGDAIKVIPHAFLHVKVYDEFAPIFGDYYVYSAPPGVNARPPTAFQGAGVPKGKFAPRAADLVKEVTEADQMAKVNGFKDLSFVLDFWRTRGDWYVRWDGKLDAGTNVAGKGAYGFYRQDMDQDILQQLSTVASTFHPPYIIVGSDMERLLATDKGAGISDAEFSNFVQFFGQAVQAIHKASPKTLVGAGINWDRFATRVAPMYGPSGQKTADTATLDTAFRAVILPLVRQADIVALKSYIPDTATTPGYYQFLRRLPKLYKVTKPIVWYSVDSPVQSDAAYNSQQQYLKDFLTWNAGVNVRLVVWRMLTNFDGADTSNQQVQGHCAKLSDPTGKFRMAQSHCYDGLFSSVFQPKPAFQFLQNSTGIKL